MQDKVDAATYFGGRNSIDKAYPAHHPMREFLCEGKGGTTSVESYDLIIQKGGRIGAHWLARAKEELAQINNCSMTDVSVLSSYNGILGEMRAYADLLRFSGWKVESGGTGAKGPDFRVESCHGQRFLVEVFSYPPRPDNEIVVEPPQKTYFKNVRGEMCSMVSSISVADPFGFPDLSKAGDSTTANAISKICARKGSEYQISDQDVSILYFDMQSLSISWSMLEQMAPILSANEAYTSGALWMAHYGEKGYPIFENASTRDFRAPKCVTMGHDGRFQGSKKSKLNAVIISVGYNPRDSSAKRLGLLENMRRPLPDLLRGELLSSGLFDGNSRCLPAIELKQRLEEDRYKIYYAATQILGADSVANLGATLHIGTDN